MKKINGELTQRSDDYSLRLSRLHEIAQDLLPMYGVNWHRHSAVVMRKETLSRALYYFDLYKKIINVPGVICEFGVQWGASTATLLNLQNILEPNNYSRKIIGFDTFKGFLDVNEKDGSSVDVGDYSTFNDYQKILDEILSIHAADSPYKHIEKYSLVKGDASETVDLWLKENPHAIVSMAIFDMDLYEPTKNVLEKILPRLVKGSILVFDELNYPGFPGETMAVNEILGLNNLRLTKSAYQPYCSYAVFGD